MPIKFDVLNRFTGSVAFTAEIECSDDATTSFKLGLAVKWAVKSRANLSGANLSRANLSGARGVSPEASTPLLMLLDQPGKIRAYKLVNERGEGPMRGGVVYEIGKSASAEANTDPTDHCGAGINVATLDWCLREWRQGFRILVVEFEAADIACIPTATDGKFRLHRCDVISEKVIDPVALGLIKAAEPVAA